MNLSEHSRKQQVYIYLLEREARWVDGPEIANERVGGSEGLKRVRELRRDLADSSYDIETRRHPNPALDIWQYRIVERSPQPVVHTDTAPAAPMQAVAQHARSGDPPQGRNAPDRRGTHLAYDPETDTYIAVYDGPVEQEIPLPPQAEGQTDMGVPEADQYKYTERPTKLELGKSIPCPKCHGIHRAIKQKGPDGKNVKVPGPNGALVDKVIGYEELTRDPKKASQICPRCNGFGLIPAEAPRAE